MKKLLLIVLAIAFITVLLTACAEADPAPTPTPDEVPAAGGAVADSDTTEEDEPEDEPEDAGLGITSIDDLRADGIVIGVQNATTGHIFAEENFENAEIDAYPLFGDAVMALLAGAVDAVIIDVLPGYEFVRANEGRLVLLEGQLTAEYYGIAFAHDSELTAKFDDAINQLRADGTFQAIYDYWIYELDGATRYVSPEGTTHPNGVLRMATSAGFPPFELWEGDAIVGFDPCLAQAIGDILGFEIYIVDMEFGNIILSVQAGQVDFGMAGMTIRDDRREYVDFSQGYFSSGQRVLVRAP